MGYSIGIIAIKGNHLADSGSVFSAFDYVDNGESKTYATWTEAIKFLDEHYVEYADRDIALRGIWVDNEWTIIYDPEMVDLIEEEKIEMLSKAIKADVWTILIQTTSGSFSFSKFSPNKVRHFFVGDGRIAEDEGVPLPEERGLNISEKISSDDLESLAKKLGFKTQPDTSGRFVVKYLPYTEQMKAKLAPFKQQAKSQPTETKPWWKVW